MDVGPFALDDTETSVFRQVLHCFAHSSARQPELLDELDERGDRQARFVPARVDASHEDGGQLSPTGVGAVHVQLAVWAISAGQVHDTSVHFYA
ncbi:hypothetical protein AC529_11675 [Thermobifida cellulosilytica TB100]|uniref:Uncharacterized protein n=1 Tax=Thermobifida cellulosilytica TB100 TaxID=665004 RepID=A0A147KH60_THECS|nr:hypothetical protein AC529_11675 [Thermobifida cellulosilytica TB100]